MGRFRKQFGDGQVQLWVETKVNLAQQPSRTVRRAWVFNTDEEATTVKKMLLEGCCSLFKDPRLVAGSRGCSSCQTRKPCSEFAQRQVNRAAPTCRLCTLSEERTKQEKRKARLESLRADASQMRLPKPRGMSKSDALAQKWCLVRKAVQGRWDQAWRRSLPRSERPTHWTERMSTEMDHAITDMDQRFRAARRRRLAPTRVESLKRAFIFLRRTRFTVGPWSWNEDDIPPMPPDDGSHKYSREILEEFPQLRPGFTGWPKGHPGFRYAGRYESDGSDGY